MSWGKVRSSGEFDGLLAEWTKDAWIMDEQLMGKFTEGVEKFKLICEVIIRAFSE